MKEGPQRVAAFCLDAKQSEIHRPTGTERLFSFFRFCGMYNTAPIRGGGRRIRIHIEEHRRIGQPGMQGKAILPLQNR